MEAFQVKQQAISNNPYVSVVKLLSTEQRAVS